MGNAYHEGTNIPITEYLHPGFREIAVAEKWGPEELERAKFALFLRYWCGEPKLTALAMEVDGWDGALKPYELKKFARSKEAQAALVLEAKKEGGEYVPGVALVRELKVWWTQVMRNITFDVKDRLAASTNLARALGVFVERKEVKHSFGEKLLELTKELDDEEDLDSEDPGEEDEG